MPAIGLRFALLLTVAALAAGLAPEAARAQALPSCIPGSGNCATVDQTGGLQHATVTQTGTGNAAEVIQHGAVEPPSPGSSLPNNGVLTGNSVVLQQAGSGNDALIQQVQHSFYGADDNCVYIRQDGGSIADVYQEGSFNRVWGLGSGDFNPLLGNSLDGSTLDVQQIGWGNELYFNQQGGATALVTQSGNMNVATVTQQ